MRTYAVTWQGESGCVHAGKLELGPETLTLDGGSARRTVSYEELEDVHVGRGASERPAGRQALVLRLRRGETLYVSSLNAPGVAAEIADLLASTIY